MQAWLNDEYPTIAARAKVEAAEIHWGDETALIKDTDRKVFLIVDNLRVHHSKPVKAWLEKHEQLNVEL